MYASFVKSVLILCGFLSGLPTSLLSEARPSPGNKGNPCHRLAQDWLKLEVHFHPKGRDDGTDTVRCCLASTTDFQSSVWKSHHQQETAPGGATSCCQFQNHQLFLGATPRNVGFLRNMNMGLTFISDKS